MHSRKRINDEPEFVEQKLAQNRRTLKEMAVLYRWGRAGREGGRHLDALDRWGRWRQRMAAIWRKRMVHTPVAPMTAMKRRQ